MTPFKNLIFLAALLAISCGQGADTAGQATQAAATPDTTASEATAEPRPNEEGAAPARKDVLYYYQQLKPPYRPDYALTEQNGKWTSVSPMTEESFPVTVDIKNGYIEINDEGTGGGTITVQVVLFRLADGSPLLGITRSNFDGVGISQTCHFLRPEDKQRLDWTAYTLPPLSGFDFLPADNAEEPQIVEKLLPVTVHLPQRGIDAEARVFTGLEYIYCRGEESEYSDYCGLYQRLTRKSLPLKWDKAAGKFEKP